MSPTPDRTLDPQQLIAELQRQLAESNAERDHLRSERDEALEQQTATTEVLQVINSSPGDLAPVFDAMLEKAMRLCEAACGQLYTYDGDRFHPIAVRGAPRFVEWWRQNGPVRPLSDGPGPLGRVARGESIVGVDDFREDAAYRTVPGFRATVDASNTRSGVTVALRNDVALLGAITIYRQEVRPFSDKQIALLQNFAAQAVIAMENARLITETREALEQQTATAEVLGVINSSPGDLAPVFDAILEKAHILCGADIGSLLLNERAHFRAIAVRGGTEEWADRLRSGFRGSETPASRPLLAGKNFVHIADLSEIQHPMAEAAVRLSGARTLLSVPLRRGDTLFGMIVAVRCEVRPYSDKEIALLQNFAAQAVIAMENARLLTETREALEQQTATAEVLQVINSSPGDLAPVFDAILEKAHILCGAAIGAFVVRDGDVFRTVATHGLPEQFDKMLRQPLPVNTIGGLHERLLRGERLIHIPDQAAGEQTNPWSRASVEIAGTRTLLAIALRKDDALLGYITASRQEVRPFSDKQIALLQNFAAQAVIAMENARLITETHEALEHQTATAEVLQVVNTSPGDLAPVFDAMLEKATRLCDAAYGVLRIWDGEHFHIGAVHGEPRFSDWLRQRGPSRPPADDPLGRIIKGEGVVHFADAPDDAGYMASPAFRQAVEVSGMRSGITVPLCKDDALLGAITVYRQEVRPFSEKQVALLQNFAAQAVIAMENARLLTETREALEQQTATAEVLQVINSSPGDLTPVFAAILEKAHHFCDAPLGSFVLRTGERWPAVATRGYSAEHDDLARHEGLPNDAPAIQRLARGEVVHVPDLTRFSASNAVTRAAVESSGSRTYLAVPLRKEGILLGYLSAHRQEVRPFSDKQIALLENFAAQAVVAMENARLLGELRQRTEEVGELNRGLEERVAEQVDELGRVGRLKRFLAPQLAELIVSQGDEKILESHRREIVVVFCDLRGYTAFTETAEPEEVLDFLREYHGALGPLVSQFEGTLDQFSGDGIMVFFNDPIPCPDPAERAVKMAMAMREVARELIAAWSRHGCELGFGIGIAQGYATLGQIGFSERSGYTAIGTVCNLAARLCAEAKDGQILVSSRVAGAVGALARLEDLGNVELKGLRRPVAAFNVVQSTSLAEARPNLTVVANGPGV